MRLRKTSVLLLLPFILSAVPGSSRSALLPTASCFDLKSFNGLETRPTASYCRNAAAAAGYNAAAHSNASAKVALERLGVDGVFFFSGHAIVGGNPSGALA